MVVDGDMVRINFYRFGFQYYVAGRFAVIAQFSPVAANLLHHAIEMLLKGELAYLDEKQRSPHSLRSMRSSRH